MIALCWVIVGLITLFMLANLCRDPNAYQKAVLAERKAVANLNRGAERARLTADYVAQCERAEALRILA